MEYYFEYFKSIFCCCFKNKFNKDYLNPNSKIFSNDEGDLLFYSCFEDDLQNK